jgi:hypothetical protein
MQDIRGSQFSWIAHKRHIRGFIIFKIKIILKSKYAKKSLFISVDGDVVVVIIDKNKGSPSSGISNINRYWLSCLRRV